MKVHPDKGGTAEGFHKLKRAYEILGDSEKKKTYDLYGIRGVSIYEMMKLSKLDNDLLEAMMGIGDWDSIMVIHSAYILCLEWVFYANNKKYILSGL